jgi:CRP-like cAMP-binding protein
MFQHFIKYSRQKSPLTDAELGRIQALSIEKKLRKKQYLLQEGDVCRHNCFIVKGCLRLYRISADGSEHIVRFGIENWWMSDRESFVTGQPSKSCIDALEDSELLMWTKENFELLESEIPAFKAFTDQLIARSLSASYNRIYTSISLTAEEKYLDFIKSYPDIFNRVPLHMIASYLGVTRETLSRIRSHFAGQ